MLPNINHKKRWPRNVEKSILKPWCVFHDLNYVNKVAQNNSWKCLRYRAALSMTVSIWQTFSKTKQFWQFRRNESFLRILKDISWPKFPFCSESQLLTWLFNPWKKFLYPPVTCHTCHAFEGGDAVIDVSNQQQILHLYLV